MWTLAMPGDKSSEKAKPRLDRRRVLLGSAAAMQLPLFTAARLEETAAAGQTAAPHSQPRYQETQHIRTFYDRSRI
jgi:hypothetical protein